MDLTERIIEWNRERNDLDYSSSLEIKLLSEEVSEYWSATSKAHKLQEMADFMFVKIGCIAKWRNSRFGWMRDFEQAFEEYKLIQEWTDEMEKDMLNDLSVDLCVDKPATLSLIFQALEIVTEANELKGKETDESGKIVKGKHHIDPLSKIEEMVS